MLIIGSAACSIEQRAFFGDSDAEYRLGLRRLVQEPPDYRGAIESLHNAALQGHVDAQKQLGRLYASVRPQPDLVRAYLWLHLAALVDFEAKRDRDQLARSMTAEQIALAEESAMQFVLGEAPDLALEAFAPSSLDVESSPSATPGPDEKVSEQRSRLFIQVGAFKARENAERLVDQLRESGYPAAVVSSALDGKDLAKVRVGPYKSHSDARAAAEKIVREAGLNGFIVKDSGGDSVSF